MKKVSLVVATFAIILPLFSAPVAAQAATWHKGSPKVARGTWTDKSKFPKGAMYDSLYISKKTFCLNDNDPRLTHISYKKVGKRSYKFYGYAGYDRKYENASVLVHVYNRHHVRVTQYGHHMNLYK